jgi:hypothetical protein
MAWLRRLIACAAFGASVTCGNARQCATGATCGNAGPCTKLSAYPVDQARACLRAPEVLPDVQACATRPGSLGIRIVCLVDSSGQFYVAPLITSSDIAGTGWHYTDGSGEQQLSMSEATQCADFSARLEPDPSKECVP